MTTKQMRVETALFSALANSSWKTSVLTLVLFHGALGYDNLW